MAHASQASTSGRICSLYTQCSPSKAAAAKSNLVNLHLSARCHAASTRCERGGLRSCTPRHALQLHGGPPSSFAAVRRYPSLTEERLVCSVSASAVGETAPGLKYDHVLIALMDDNPYLSDGSKQVLATTAGLASINKSRLTVLLVDAKPSTEEGTSWIEAASWHLKEHGYDPGSAAFQEVSLDSEESHNSSVVVGDAVDQVSADLVVLSAEAVHSKKVDCNLLAEFCTAPACRAACLQIGAKA